MNFLKWLTMTATNAADAVADANRKLALQNRLKAIERAETRKSRDAYEALGRWVAAHAEELPLPEDALALKETAETAEQHAALARGHIEEESEPAQEMAFSGEETDNLVELFPTADMQTPEEEDLASTPKTLELSLEDAIKLGAVVPNGPEDNEPAVEEDDDESLL